MYILLPELLRFTDSFLPVLVVLLFDKSSDIALCALFFLFKSLTTKIFSRTCGRLLYELTKTYHIFSQFSKEMFAFLYVQATENTV